MNLSADPQIARKITRLYLLALTAVALLSIGGQYLVQRSLESQSNDSRVVNIAGRQRMLSQKITKTVLLLQEQPDSLLLATYLADLNEALNLWQKSHKGLQSGYLAYIQTPVNNSDSTRAMFAAINPLFGAIYNNTTAVSKYFQQFGNNIPVSADIRNNIQIILDNERAYLGGMNQIVFQYDAEAKRRVNASQQIELILLLCTLIILVLEGLFIFRPAVRQIQRTIGLLIDSEQRTHRVNEELVGVNKSLEETREALLRATEEKYRQQINEQKMRSAYLIEGQEEERKRVALEIHDGLGQMLTALKFGIEKIGDSVNSTETVQQDLEELRGLVSQAISEARTISFNLMPAVLNDFGISSALKLLTAQVASNAAVNVTFNTNWNGKRLARNLEIGLYRVSQEALNNAVKYAEATDITVELWHKKKYIHLTILDNGRGFSPQKLSTRSRKSGPSHGISNMKERVYIINGDININSQPGQGTQIHVKVPLLLTEHA
ncbi:MAG: ATP-binding protein [Adhaeribacter sp.]